MKLDMMEKKKERSKTPQKDSSPNQLETTKRHPKLKSTLGSPT